MYDFCSEITRGRRGRGARLVLSFFFVLQHTLYFVYVQVIWQEFRGMGFDLTYHGGRCLSS